MEGFLCPSQATEDREESAGILNLSLKSGKEDELLKLLQACHDSRCGFVVLTLYILTGTACDPLQSFRLHIRLTIGLY